jgi:hypothetical protein
VANDIPVVKEFPNMFLKELSGLPLEREVEVSINTFPEVPPIAQSLYQLVLVELNKLKTQLQELLDKGFIRPSNSPQ